jgi:hypothetical protein
VILVAQQWAMQESGQRNTVLLAVIVACEIGFWVILLAGLVARYVLRRPGLGGALLLCVPLVDLVLITVSVIDLRIGGTAGLMHSLAAVYLGLTVAFGPELVRRADDWFAHRFDNGPEPARSSGNVGDQWKMWSRCLAALMISAGLTLCMYFLAEQSANALTLWNFQLQLAMVTGIWLFAGPIRVTLFPPGKVGQHDRG